MTDPTAPEARVVLIGKPGCHLCDEARPVVAQVCREAGVPWREQSILEDIALEMAYWEFIPVVLIDGREVARWRVDPAALAGDLRAAGLARPHGTA